MSWNVALRIQVGTLALDVAIDGDDRPVAVIGPNGSGKTTLLRVIAGAHRPTSGHIRVGGRTLFDSGRGIELPPQERSVGYVPQGFGLFPHLTAIDNVAFGLTTAARRGAKAEARRRAADLLADLDGDQLVDRLPAQLSGGEQQRVALARALITEPALLLLDEPLAAMDATARRKLRTLLVSHVRARSRPAIVVTHAVRDVVAFGGDVVVLEAGRVVQKGPVAVVAAHPANDFVAEFFTA